MSGVPHAIMNAAERRIRIGGFHGFSFRDIAADVGVKSSTVHYHFPTKETLAAAVMRRYTDDAATMIDQEEAESRLHPIRGWIQRFRRTLHSTEHMCPAAVLGTENRCLAPDVAVEVRRFFKMCHAKMVAGGLTPSVADRLLATITGALVVSAATHDLESYDRATRDLEHELQPRKKSNGTTTTGTKRRVKAPA